MTPFKAPRFEIRGKAKQYHWVLIAANGAVLCASETFTRKSDCQGGIHAAIETASCARTYVLDATPTDGLPTKKGR